MFLFFFFLMKLKLYELFSSEIPETVIFLCMYEGQFPDTWSCER